LLVERTFAPRIARGTGPMRGFTERALPPLRGYVLTYAKPRAELLMTTGEDPLLVSWRHGLGRVTAFTSDLGGRWGREWVAWQGLPQWTSQITRATMRRIAQTRTNVAFRAEGDTVRIVADLVSTDGQFRNQLDLQGKITGPSGKAATRALPQTAPGRYEGVFSPSERGIHYVTLFAESGREEEPSPMITVPYVASYSEEYRALGADLNTLTRLAQDTGGEVLNPQDIAAGLKRLYTPMPGRAFRGDSGWWPLAALALLLFLADLALRSVRRRTRAPM
jgi:hypothetical protein